jgi:putative DNA primase/helicase
MNAVEAVDEFRGAVAAAGLKPPARIIADGALHRFRAGAKRGASGWYVLHIDGLPAGAFGDWRTGVSQRWRAASSSQISDVEHAELRERIERQRREREAEQARLHAEARARALRLWQSAEPASPLHPYLLRKQVKQHGLRQRGNALLVPMRAGGVLHSLQFIEQDGRKRFLSGGRVSHCYFGIGRPSGSILICEGYATGASIYEATGHAVAVAFNAGNLLPVARALRTRFPALRLIVCADDDIMTDGNPGLTKAREAARAVSGLLAVPAFGAQRPDGASDFNDLLLHAGPAAVRERIEQAAPVRDEFGEVR